MDENDRWFEQAHGHIEELEEALVRLQASVDSLVSIVASGGSICLCSFRYPIVENFVRRRIL